MNASDQSKHQPEPKNGTENPNGPESEGTDGSDTSINVPGDYIGTDVIFVTDGTGPKEVMGGIEHSKSEFSHKNNDMNSNDQYKQGPKTDFGTDNPKRPELEGTDGGNVGTDVISPQEGASDDESDEPAVLPSYPPLSGKLLAYQQFLDSKKHQIEEKKKKIRKRKKRRKEKEKNQREIMTNYFLLQRTGLEICHLEWLTNFSTMMFSRCTCTTLFKMTLIH
jgi:hypothetical protein